MPMFKRNDNGSYSFDQDGDKRSERRANERVRNRLHGYRKMTADELYDALKDLADQHDLPVEIDGSADTIPVTVRHTAWALYFYPQTVPVRIERQGELPDGSDDPWKPLWTCLESLGTVRANVNPLSAKGYRLFTEVEPKSSRLEEMLRKRR